VVGVVMRYDIFIAAKTDRKLLALKFSKRGKKE
jgi:hypothetical protein